jgi:hypothetical protein
MIILVYFLLNSSGLVGAKNLRKRAEKAFASSTLVFHAYGHEMGLPEVRHLIVLPESMCRGAIECAHHAVAHKAVEATVAELHKTVYFAGMYRWVNKKL